MEVLHGILHHSRFYFTCGGNTSLSVGNLFWIFNTDIRQGQTDLKKIGERKEKSLVCFFKIYTL